MSLEVRLALALAVFVFHNTNALALDTMSLVIIKSSVPDFRPGQIVESKDSFDLPKGASMVLVSESGKRLTIQGPHNGPLKATMNPIDNLSLLETLSKLVTPTEPGTHLIAVMRAPGEPSPADPWVIDIERGSDKCVLSDAPVILWRAKSTYANTFDLTNLRDQSSAAIRWPASSSTLEWPLGVTLSDGDSYRVELKEIRVASNRPANAPFLMMLVQRRPMAGARRCG